MNRSQRDVPFLHWAKTRSDARFNLARSGVLSVKWSELDVEPASLEITGDNGHGYWPLMERIAARYGAAPRQVVTAQGASLANFLLMGALLERGDRVLIERPCYEPLARAAEFFGAQVEYFDRLFAEDYRLDVERFRAALAPGTRLVILTSLHNPSGRLLDEDTLRLAGEAAAQIGAYVLVDEAYLEFIPGARPAFALGPNFVSSNSLTKVYGLDGLRCGWLVAPEDVAERARRMANLLHVEGVLIGEIAAAHAFDRIGWLAERSRRLMAANRALLDAFLAENEAVLECVPPDGGTICFPRLRHASAAKLAALLREKYETSVVPGEFFASPQHIRISIGNATGAVREGLSRVSQALREL